jgi:hypothetical protein
MAKMYPEVFPGQFDQRNPEFIVYQSLRKLPASYVVLYSKRFNGGLFGKPECEIDFVISNQRDVVTCLEVKAGVLFYDGTDWLGINRATYGSTGIAGEKITPSGPFGMSDRE